MLKGNIYISFCTLQCYLKLYLSRTIVLIILESVCTCDFDFSQQLDATFLTAKLQQVLNPLQYRAATNCT